MSFVDRIRSWWSRDAVEHAEQETRMTAAERDREEEDFEARKDDAFAPEHLGAPGVDFERDSEPPPHP